MLCNLSSSYAPLLFQKMPCYTIFFHLSASLEVTHNGTNSLSLPFGGDAPPTQSPWIVAPYDRYNENIAKTTSARNVLHMPPFSLCTVVQLYLLTLPYGYLCPSPKEVAAYVGVLVGFLVVNTKPALGTLANPSQKPMLSTVSRCIVNL
ncbi:unnamed protein product [Rhizopus microsporus]